MLGGDEDFLFDPPFYLEQYLHDYISYMTEFTGRNNHKLIWKYQEHFIFFIHNIHISNIKRKENTNLYQQQELCTYFSMNRQYT